MGPAVDRYGNTDRRSRCAFIDERAASHYPRPITTGGPASIRVKGASFGVRTTLVIESS
jgi:hypothetical protein